MFTSGTAAIHQISISLNVTVCVCVCVGGGGGVAIQNVTAGTICCADKLQTLCHY